MTSRKSPKRPRWDGTMASREKLYFIYQITSMKLLLILSSIFLLASCQQYKYEVTYEKCNGQTGSVSYKNNWTPKYNSLRRELYIPEDKWYILDTPSYEIRNICDFTYVRTPITK